MGSPVKTRGVKPRPLFGRIVDKILFLWRFHFLRDPTVRGVRTLYRVMPDTELLHAHPLPSGAVILELGGFTGVWVDRVLAYAPDATYHVFEPLDRYVGMLKKRFAGKRKVHIHPYGIGATSAKLSISVLGEGSSIHRGSGAAEIIQVKAVDEVFASLKLDHVDVLAMNVEGSEYEILPRMLEKGLVGKIDKLLVQFHNIDRSSAPRRRAIREALGKTHVCLFEIPFVWEIWNRKPSGNKAKAAKKPV